eukprot:COSAG01_NODE_4169_length_5274_cov_8.543575_9_plen_72_part_00
MDRTQDGNAWLTAKLVGEALDSAFAALTDQCLLSSPAAAADEAAISATASMMDARLGCPKQLSISSACTSR